MIGLINIEINLANFSIRDLFSGKNKVAEEKVKVLEQEITTMRQADKILEEALRRKREIARLNTWSIEEIRNKKGHFRDLSTRITRLTGDRKKSYFMLCELIKKKAKISPYEEIRILAKDGLEKLIHTHEYWFCMAQICLMALEDAQQICRNKKLSDTVLEKSGMLLEGDR